MTHVTRRRHVAALAFATTCGFLAGMAVMAVLTLMFRAEPYVPGRARGSADRPARDAAARCPAGRA